MPNVTIPLALGKSQTGLTLTAQLTDTTGANSGNAIASGFAELGAGFYIWTYNLATGFQGGVKFLNGTTLMVATGLNPWDTAAFSTGLIQAILSMPDEALFANLSAMITGSGAMAKYTTVALSNAPAGGGGSSAPAPILINPPIGSNVPPIGFTVGDLGFSLVQWLRNADGTVPQNVNLSGTPFIHIQQGVLPGAGITKISAPCTFLSVLLNTAVVAVACAYTFVSPVFTDLIASQTGGVGPYNRVRSASGRAFSQFDVTSNAVLTITSNSGGWTAGNYNIISVANGIATLSSACATSAATAGAATISTSDLDTPGIYGYEFKVPTTSGGFVTFSAGDTWSFKVAAPYG